MLIMSILLVKVLNTMLFVWADCRKNTSNYATPISIYWRTWRIVQADQKETFWSWIFKRFHESLHYPDGPKPISDSDVKNLGAASIKTRGSALKASNWQRSFLGQASSVELLRPCHIQGEQPGFRHWRSVSGCWNFPLSGLLGDSQRLVIRDGPYSRQ